MSLINRKKLKNKECLCKECLKKLPCTVAASILDFEPEQIKTVKKYMDDNHQSLLESFERSDSIGSLHIDYKNGYFALYGKQLKKKQLPRKCRDIYKFSEVVNAEIVCKNVRSSNTKYIFSIVVDIELCFRLRNPDISVKIVIASEVFCDTFRDTKGQISYLEPSKVIDFRKYLNQIIQQNCNTSQQYRETYNNRSNQYRKSNSSSTTQNTDFVKAAALFMLDDKFTKAELKKQRNRLMKTFHPDTSGNNEDMDMYAKKINDAYNLLLKYCVE